MKTYPLSPGVQIVTELAFPRPFSGQHFLLFPFPPLQHVVEIRQTAHYYNGRNILGSAVVLSLPSI